jgi:hypothetical protein
MVKKLFDRVLPLYMAVAQLLLRCHAQVPKLLFSLCQSVELFRFHFLSYLLYMDLHSTVFFVPFHANGACTVPLGCIGHKSCFFLLLKYENLLNFCFMSSFCMALRPSSCQTVPNISCLSMKNGREIMQPS